MGSASLDPSGAARSARALEDLARLRADYPGSPEIAASWYWAARAHETSGDLDEACAAFDRAVMEGRAVGDPDLVERAVAASRGCAPDGLRFTLQLGAFSRRPPAEDLAASARAGGFEARIVPEGGLEKVRVGRFSSPETARALERRLREKGFSVAVVASER